MGDEEDLLRKINGLLKKAEGTDNEHESSAFFEKAHELMVKYAIDEARIRAAQKRLDMGRIEQPVVENFMFSSYAHHAQAKQVLFEMVAKAHSVRTFPYENRKGDHLYGELAEANRGLKESKWVKLVGYKDDIEHVKLLYLSLVIQSQRYAGEDWRLRYGAAKHSDWNDGHLGKFTWMSGHMEGFAYRIGERFKELTQAIYESTAGADALILDKDANILEWMYEHGILRRPTPPAERVHYCWAPEPEENRPMNADGRTRSKKWKPAYCIIHKPAADAPHEGEHIFNYRPAKVSMSYYSPKGRRESYEGRNAGRSAADRADIGLTQMGSKPSQIKG